MGGDAHLSGPELRVVFQKYNTLKRDLNDSTQRLREAVDWGGVIA